MIAKLQAVFLLEAATCKATLVNTPIGSEEAACLVKI
jgi:hypothetical protein